MNSSFSNFESGKKVVFIFLNISIGWFSILKYISSIETTKKWAGGSSVV